MSEVLKFRRKVEERYDGDKMKIEEIGTRTYRITTGNSEEFDFRNRIKAERFDREFISQLNRFMPTDQQLDYRDRDVYNVLNDLRRKLEDDADNFELKISFRMTH